MPSRKALGHALQTPDAVVDRALRFLASARALVLDEAGEVLMAHPFSAVETPFRVTTTSGSCWANCAWDAIAVPMLLGRGGRAQVRCPASGASIVFEVVVSADASGGALQPTDAVVLFPVPARRFWDDIGFT